jgi:DNA-binding MarR family transcriptional regulator
VPRTHDDIHDARHLLLILARVGAAISQALGEAVGPEMADNAPVLTIFALDEHGSLRPGQLQEITGLSSGGVSKLLDRLQGAGLLTREYGVLSEDRRGSVVRLTAKGRRTSRTMAEAVTAQVPELRVLLKEVQEFVALYP